MEFYYQISVGTLHSGRENLIKVKKLQHVSRLGREQNLVKQHKKAWQREWLRLTAQRKKLQVRCNWSHQFGAIQVLHNSFFLEIQHPTTSW